MNSLPSRKLKFHRWFRNFDQDFVIVYLYKVEFAYTSRFHLFGIEKSLTKERVERSSTNPASGHALEREKQLI